MNDLNITAVILAAGKGTRMKSGNAKVLHKLFFKPMLHHVLDTVTQTEIDHTAVIVGHQRQKVLDSLTGYTFTPVFQDEQLGTGHAVLCAEEACDSADLVMILCGDTPLIRPETLQAMIKYKQWRLSSFGATGVWHLVPRKEGQGQLGMVDYLSPNPGYGFIPLLQYQHATGVYYNAFHNAGVRTQLNAARFVPKEWKHIPGERNPKKAYQNLWIASRGPASHGCTRVEVWEADYLNDLFFIRMPVHVWDK